MKFLFSVDKVENGYVLTLTGDGSDFNAPQYAFNTLAKLQKALKEVLASEKPDKEGE